MTSTPREGLDANNYIASPQSEQHLSIQPEILADPTTFDSEAELYTWTAWRLKVLGWDSVHFPFSEQRPITGPTHPLQMYATLDEYVEAGEQQIRAIDWAHLGSCLELRGQGVYAGLFDKVLYDYFERYHPGLNDFAGAAVDLGQAPALVEEFDAKIEEMRIEAEEKVLREELTATAMKLAEVMAQLQHGAAEKDELVRLQKRRDGWTQEIFEIGAKMDRLDTVGLGRYAGL